MENVMRLIAVAICFVVSSLFADMVEITDFAADAYANAGRWNLGEAEYDGDNGMKLSAGDTGIESPVYGGPVVRLALATRCQNMRLAAPSSLQILGRSAAGEDWRECGGATFVNGSSTNMVFALSRHDDVRQLRIVFKKVSGTLRIVSAAATWRAAGELETPSAIEVFDVVAGGFSAAWHVDDEVDAFRFRLWREIPLPWSGDSVWSETFAGCDNAGGSSKRYDKEGMSIDSITDNPGWKGEYIYAPAGIPGMLQLNKASSSTGWLESPVLPDAGIVTAVVRARAFAWQNDRVMPVFRLRNGATNLLAEIELDTETKDFVLPGVDVAAGDKLLFRSFVKNSQRRVLIDSVDLVRDFRAGSTATNWIMEKAELDEARINVDGLEPGATYRFAVASVAGENESAPSETVAVTLPVAAAGDSGAAEGDWEGAKIVAASANSFALSWMPLEGAAEYRISVWTNAVFGRNPGVPVWTDGFSGAPESSSTTALNTGSFNEQYADTAGWTVLSNVYPSAVAGTVRVGNSSTCGALLSPPLENAAGKTLLVRAWRHSGTDGVVMPVDMDSSGEILPVGTVRLADEPADFHLPLPAGMKAGVRLVFNSTTNLRSSRVVLDLVAVLDGYSAGEHVLDCVVDDEAVAAAGYVLPHSPTAEYHYSVKALDAAGREISASAGTVDLAHPPPCPVLEAVRLSALPRKSSVRTWNEDFNAMAPIYSGSKEKAPWYNGLTLPPWQLFKGDAAPENLSRNTGGGNTAGFYAYWATNRTEASYALGTKSSESSPVLVFGAAFANDTEGMVRKVSVRYRGLQFGFRNDVEQKLEFDFLVTNELANVDCAGDWKSCPALAFASPVVGAGDAKKSGEDLPVAVEVESEIQGSAVPPGSYLVVRWRRGPAVNGAALAVDDVAVSFESPSSFVIIVR